MPSLNSLAERISGVIGEIRKVAAALRNELLAGITAEDLETGFRVLQSIKQRAERS